MMKRLRREQEFRDQKKIFWISTEGARSEPIYFKRIQELRNEIVVKLVKTNDRSDPESVLRQLKQKLKENRLRELDQAWLVVDRDNWSETQINILVEWASKKANYGLAISNPKFELWLVMHFEKGKKIHSSQDCNDRLERYIPGYNKKFDPKLFTIDRINQAISHAKQRDCPPCTDWPQNPGTTTVYRLIQKLLEE